MGKSCGSVSPKRSSIETLGEYIEARQRQPWQANHPRDPGFHLSDADMKRTLGTTRGRQKQREAGIPRGCIFPPTHIQTTEGTIQANSPRKLEEIMSQLKLQK